MAKWTNLSNGIVFNTMTDGIRHILANTKGIVKINEDGTQFLDDKIVKEIAEKSGMDSYRICSTFANDIREKITDIDKKTGIRKSVFDAQKIRASKEAKKNIEKATENSVAVEATEEKKTKKAKAKAKKNVVAKATTKKEDVKSYCPDDLDINPDEISNAELLAIMNDKNAANAAKTDMIIA